MNNIKLAGEVVGKAEIYFQTKYGMFYRFFLKTKRLSGVEDILPCVVSGKLLNEITENERICLYGEVRTYNKRCENKSKLIVYVYVKSVSEFLEDINEVALHGFVCKAPVYRKTPLGREIADILLAVNYPNRKSSYIPCICWGRNARMVGDMQLGAEMFFDGRLQSREYQKKLEDGVFENRVAYELSVGRIKFL